MKWLRTATGGWIAISATGRRLTIQRYRAWKGKQPTWTYVPRIDGTAHTSPATAYPTLTEAKAAVEFPKSESKAGLKAEWHATGDGGGHWKYRR